MKYLRNSVRLRVYLVRTYYYYTVLYCTMRQTPNTRNEHLNVTADNTSKKARRNDTR